MRWGGGEPSRCRTLHRHEGHQNWQGLSLRKAWSKRVWPQEGAGKGGKNRQPWGLNEKTSPNPLLLPEPLSVSIFSIAYMNLIMPYNHIFSPGNQQSQWWDISPITLGDHTEAEGYSPGWHLLHYAQKTSESWIIEQEGGNLQEEQTWKTTWSQGEAALVPGDIPVPGSRPWWDSTTHPTLDSGVSHFYIPKTNSFSLVLGCTVFCSLEREDNHTAKESTLGRKIKS